MITTEVIVIKIFKCGKAFCLAIESHMTGFNKLNCLIAA